MIRKTPNKQNVIEKLKIEGLLSEKGSDIANELGEYFANVGKKLCKPTTPSKTSQQNY